YPSPVKLSSSPSASPVPPEEPYLVLSVFFIG
ncbi:hypothetical protein A2U01_0091320, partial [Trifolium medium]|nr:hypothetical protein [Trifolium medium]